LVYILCALSSNFPLASKLASKKKRWKIEQKQVKKQRE